jgi:hypothetical protein
LNLDRIEVDGHPSPSSFIKFVSVAVFSRVKTTYIYEESLLLFFDFRQECNVFRVLRVVHTTSSGQIELSQKKEELKQPVVSDPLRVVNVTHSQFEIRARDRPTIFSI